MYQGCDENGILDKKIGKKGVLLARRDNSLFLRKIYENVTNLIFDKIPKEEIKDYLNQTINDLFRNQIPYSDYIITKSVGSTEGDLNEDEGKLGDYKIKQLSTDLIEREIQLKGKTEREYYISSCPAQVQLAEKLKKRGIRVDTGSRIEYVIIQKLGAKLQGEKIEEYDYFKKYTKYLKIDSLYYLQSLINPLDQILQVGLKENDFMSYQYKIRLQYQKVITELNNLFAPKIIVQNN